MKIGNGIVTQPGLQLSLAGTRNLLAMLTKQRLSSVYSVPNSVAPVVRKLNVVNAALKTKPFLQLVIDTKVESVREDESHVGLTTVGIAQGSSDQCYKSMR